MSHPKRFDGTSHSQISFQLIADAMSKDSARERFFGSERCSGQRTENSSFMKEEKQKLSANLEYAHAVNLDKIGG
ncbi:hypothetical protein BFW86_09585 [Pseudomonas fluorescens]|nr:hypothetical protein BFW86_09585 [Pseudomonas fluorescens]